MLGLNVPGDTALENKNNGIGKSSVQAWAEQAQLP